MTVQFSGRALAFESYKSKKTSEIVNQLKVFDGRDLVRISGVPDTYRTVKFGDSVSFFIRIINTENGMFSVYDKEVKV